MPANCSETLFLKYYVSNDLNIMLVYFDFCDLVRVSQVLMELHYPRTT